MTAFQTVDAANGIETSAAAAAAAAAATSAETAFCRLRCRQRGVGDFLRKSTACFGGGVLYRHLNPVTVRLVPPLDSCTVRVI